MMSTAMVCDVEDEEQERPAGEDILDAFDLRLDPLKVTIAKLSDQDIRRMRSLELMDVIRFSGVFNAREWFKQLRFMEHEDLNRLAYLARKACQREINTAYERRGRRVPFFNEMR